MTKLRSAIAALAILLPVPAAAQVNIANLPVNTVVGRLGITTGPAQAIPFATLLTQIAAVPTSRTISTTSPLSGGGDLSANRTLSITTNGISNTLIRQSAALSLVGRSANSLGNVADISAVAGSSCVFLETSSTLACGQIATAGITNNSVTDAKLRQGTALSLIGRSANSLGNVADIAAVAGSDCVYRESGSAVGCGTVATAGLANNAVTNAKQATMAAYTLKGNSTGSSAAPTDISIPALTHKAVPSSSDILMISDVSASNALKYATLAEAIGALASGVSSIAGNTGAFTLSRGLTNSTNDIRRALNEATLQASPSNPTGTTSATAKMMGLGTTCTLTPVYSTRVRLRFQGSMANSTSAQSNTVQARYGTGTAPANGDTGTAGTAIGTAVEGWAPTTNAKLPFSVGGIITGLTASTAYWFDLTDFVSSGTGTLTGISCEAEEF